MSQSSISSPDTGSTSCKSSCCSSQHPDAAVEANHENAPAHIHDHTHDHAHDHTHEQVGDNASCSSEQTGGCGCTGNPVFDGVDDRYKMMLWLVIGINAVMFAVEIVAGKMAGSQALQADALDFLGDSLTYGISLAVIGMSLKVRSTAALLKGFSLMAMGLWVFGSTIYQTLILGLPRAEMMGLVGLLALAANVASVLLLMRYKDGDANVRSVWLCSRNDAIGNVAVLVASLMVYVTTSAWPDLIVAFIMGGLFLRSAQLILRQSWQEFKSADGDMGGTTGPQTQVS